MPFICKSCITSGEVEQMILLETFEEAVKWANRHARVVETLYSVDIYELNFGIPFDDAYSPGNPIRIIKPCN